MPDSYRMVWYAILSDVEPRTDRYEPSPFIDVMVFVRAPGLGSHKIRTIS